MRWRICSGREKRESLLVFQPIVNLEPTQANHLRMGELSSEMGEHVMASQAYLQLAELAESAGGNYRSWFERAHTEDPADAKIAVALWQEPAVAGRGGGGDIHFRAAGAGRRAHRWICSICMRQALLSAGRYLDAEPLIWQMFGADPGPHAPSGEPDRKHDRLRAGCGGGDAGAKAGSFPAAAGGTPIVRRHHARIFGVAPSNAGNAGISRGTVQRFQPRNRLCPGAAALFDLYARSTITRKRASAWTGPRKWIPTGRASETAGVAAGEDRRTALQRDCGALRDREERGGAGQAPKPTLGAAALQDLMLQAEILVQYGMRSKAIERLQRIQELFPHEEERNQDLQRLYISAGIEPQYAKSMTAARRRRHRRQGVATRRRRRARRPTSAAWQE